MTIQQVCEKYGIYVEKDIDIAWDLYVTKEENAEEADMHGAMLAFAARYFRVRRESEQTHLADDEKALKFIIVQINGFLRRDGQHCVASGKGKTRNKAVLAALGKLDWHYVGNCPVEVTISGEDGKFLCEVRGSIVCTKKFGEKTMELVGNDRFTTHWLAIAYGAMCKNSNACYQIGIALSDRDRSRAARVWDDIECFPFSDVVITGKNWGNPNATTRYTLKPVMPVYWFHLGAQEGSSNSAYRAAKIFREQNVYPMYEKYMFHLTTYDNNYRSEAELDMLEFYSTETNRNFVTSQIRRDALLSRLVGKYAAAPSSKLSRQALMTLAEVAHQQKKREKAVQFYQLAGITAPEKAYDENIVERIGYALYYEGKKEESLPWLRWLLDNGECYDWDDIYDKLGHIYMDRWKNNKDKKAAATAAEYWQEGELSSEQMAQLLQLYADKVIVLDDEETVMTYAQESCSLLDAKTAMTLAVRLWQSNKTADLPVPVALMRRALDQNKTNGVYWNNLGVMLCYNTVYGQGYSAQRLQEAKSCFEKALSYGHVRVKLRLSDICWSDEKEGFPQDFETAKKLLLELLEADPKWAKPLVHSRLARIAKLEKQPMDVVVAQLVKAYEADPKSSKEAERLDTWYGQWLSEYVVLLHQEGTAPENMEKLFCGNYEFLYAVACRMETAGRSKAAIVLYGCCAAMGSKKALCNLYNMAKTGTDYFAKREACV